MAIFTQLQLLPREEFGWIEPAPADAPRPVPVDTQSIDLTVWRAGCVQARQATTRFSRKATLSDAGPIPGEVPSLDSVPKLAQISDMMKARVHGLMRVGIACIAVYFAGHLFTQQHLAALAAQQVAIATP